MFSFAKRNREPGWLAVCPLKAHVEFAHVTRESVDKPVLRRWLSAPLPAVTSAGIDPIQACLDALVKPHELKSFRCTTMPGVGDYQLIQIEAPPVSDAEMKEALRWKLKDLIDIPADSAIFDILPIPDSGSANRPRQLFLAVANRAALAPVVERFQSAELDLAAVDLPELAQRNIAELFEDENRGLAFLAFGDSSALLTFTYRGELFAFRRIEIGSELFAQATPERRLQLAERVVLEMQRSMDTVDRQFSAISLSQMIVALPPESGLEEQFRNVLYLPFTLMDLGSVMDLSAFPELADPEAQRRALLTIGAALRTTEVAA